MSSIRSIKRGIRANSLGLTRAKMVKHDSILKEINVLKEQLSNAKSKKDKRDLRERIEALYDELKVVKSKAKK